MDNQHSHSVERYTVASAWVSFGLSTLILAMKFYAYYQTKSAAVLSDALESIVNVISSFVALLVMRAVAEPADEEHPYGHGKLEYFSSAFEGGMIAFAALLIGYAAIYAMVNKQPLHELDIGILIMVGTAVLNLLLGLHLLTVGRRHKSEALVASGKHVMSDVVTTVGVVVGLGLVKLFGWLWLDPLMALIVAIHLLMEGYKIVRRSIGGLIDEKEPIALSEVAEAFRKCLRPGIIDIHHLKLIRAGRFHHIDAHVVVPEFWDVIHAHNMTHDFEKDVVSAYPYDGEIAFHIDPCNRAFCISCDIVDCPVRQHPFQKKRDFSPENLIKGPVKDT